MTSVFADSGPVDGSTPPGYVGNLKYPCVFPGVSTNKPCLSVSQFSRTSANKVLFRRIGSHVLFELTVK